MKFNVKIQNDLLLKNARKLTNKSSKLKNSLTLIGNFMTIQKIFLLENARKLINKSFKIRKTR